MSKINELMEGVFQGGENFGFFIPKERDYYGGDFYVTKENFNGAVTGDKVDARELKVSKGKKPEAKIVFVVGKKPVKEQVFVEGIYSSGDGNFGFIDVEGQQKGYFVYGNKKGEAKEGDKVKAQLLDFKGKPEAIVVKILSTEEELLVGRFKDSDRFGFVIPDESKNNDIFIAGSRKNGAKDGDMVEVRIVKRGGKNPEGIVKRIIN